MYVYSRVVRWKEGPSVCKSEGVCADRPSPRVLPHGVLGVLDAQPTETS